MAGVGLCPSVQVTGKRRGDQEIEGAPEFPEAFAQMQEFIANGVAAAEADVVVITGYNSYATDYPWLRTMCHRHAIDWPASWKWGWDVYRSIR